MTGANEQSPIRTLILSGGGGRGAFHVGAYKYLSTLFKDGVDIAHHGEWQPEIIVGTSIGAVNGAAMTQGITADELERFWREMKEADVEGLPPSMGPLARWTANMAYSGLLDTKLPVVPPDEATSPEPPDSWPELPLLPPGLSERLIGRWANLLDTGPLKKTLVEKWGITPEKLAASDTTLLINATNVQSGELTIFSNKPVTHKETHAARPDVKVGIDVQRILASCSIPLVYPWTEVDGEYYWDGAVVANTPLGPALDAAAEKYDISRPLEAVIVLMTPWRDASWDHLPNDFGEAMTWVLDWALLASFRADLRLLKAFNERIELDRAAGHPQRYRYVKPIIVAPNEFLPVTRIIDYHVPPQPGEKDLYEQGFDAAQAAFQQAFPA